MSAKRVLSPSLRVPNDDYHYQSMIVLMKNSRLLDKLIQMAPVMRINEKTLWALLRKKQVSRVMFLSEVDFSNHLRKQGTVLLFYFVYCFCFLLLIFSRF